MANKASYSIKKISNGEFKEINKKLKLNVGKYCGNRASLYFDVEGEELPIIFDSNLFYSITVEQIQKGLIEHLSYNDGIITMTIRDGNVLKNYAYDFSFGDFKGQLSQSASEELKNLVYKIVSMYNENPNKSMSSEQRYLRMILDIIDGVRLPKIEDPNELLRVFEVYSADKPAILLTLLQNVIFFDENGKVLEYGKHLRAQKLKAVKYDVLTQMETAMLMFAVNNNAYELYRQYNNSIYIPRRELVYKYVDENGKEVLYKDDVEPGTIFSLGKEVIKKGLTNIKDLAVSGAQTIADKISEHKRTK